MQIRWQRVFWAGNQGIHQNFDKSLLTYKCWLIFMRMKQNFFWKKKIKMADSKKRSFSSSTNSQYFFMKISWISPWVSRIDWCEGHWFCSTYMAVRLSDISSKTGQKCIFWVFLAISELLSFFELVILNFFFSIFFFLHPNKNQSTFIG